VSILGVYGSEGDRKWSFTMFRTLVETNRTFSHSFPTVYFNSLYISDLNAFLTQKTTWGDKRGKKYINLGVFAGHVGVRDGHSFKMEYSFVICDHFRLDTRLLSRIRVEINCVYFG